jgi:hypothetical protein
VIFTVAITISGDDLVIVLPILMNRNIIMVLTFIELLYSVLYLVK